MWLPFDGHDSLIEIVEDFDLVSVNDLQISAFNPKVNKPYVSFRVFLENRIDRAVHYVEMRVITNFTVYRWWSYSKKEMAPGDSSKGRLLSPADLAYLKRAAGEDIVSLVTR